MGTDTAVQVGSLQRLTLIYAYRRCRTLIQTRVSRPALCADPARALSAQWSALALTLRIQVFSRNLSNY